MATSILYDFEITGIHLVLLFDVAGFIHSGFIQFLKKFSRIKIYSDIYAYLIHIAQPSCRVLRGEINNLFDSCSCLHKYFQL